MTSQLIINNVTAEDFGVYKCLGSNAKGEHFDYVTLHGTRLILGSFGEYEPLKLILNYDYPVLRVLFIRTDNSSSLRPPLTPAPPVFDVPRK